MSENKIKDRNLLYEEHTMLRQELRDLKECQIKFLTFSVTATGVLLGLASSLAHTVPGTYLFPLTVLIPSWWIFFDKATTITRIVGYYRILERAILTPNSVKVFIGWENALAKFRDLESKGMLKLESEDKSKKSKYKSKSSQTEESLIHRFVEFALLKTSHRYWVLAYYTFFGLSMLCLGLSFHQEVNFILLSLAAIITIISAVENAKVVSNLIWGRNSYKANEHFWEQILKVEKVT